MLRCCCPAVSLGSIPLSCSRVIRGLCQCRGVLLSPLPRLLSSAPLRPSFPHLKQVLSLLATKHQPGALVEVTAGGLVAVVMNVLQQQAMAGVLVSEVCWGVGWVSGLMAPLVERESRGQQS